MSRLNEINHASLTIVGLGIKLISHINIETKACIERANKVLYLVNEPLMKEWIIKTNSSAESLETLYTKYQLRIECYRAITCYILDALKNNQHVCVVVYGHPTFFSQPALDAAKIAKEQGCQVKALPAISAEACLFADLLIDPGDCGSQSFEATDFLIHKRQFDPNSHLILWQIACIGVLTHIMKPNRKGIEILVSYLKQFYDLQHEVIVYEASQYPHLSPLVIKKPLNKLAFAKLSPLSTLYVPPQNNTFADSNMLKKLI